MLSYKVERQVMGRHKAEEVAFPMPCPCGASRTVRVRNATGVFPTSITVTCRQCSLQWEGHTLYRLSEWAESGEPVEWWVGVIRRHMRDVDAACRERGIQDLYA